jgi:hypothetical protein
MNNKIIISIVGLVLIAISFYGGIKYNQNQPTSAFQARGNFTGGQRGNRNGLNGSGFVNGEILSKDATSITIKIGGSTGGSKIVLVSPSTDVMKTILGSLGDLSVGTQITAMGTANSDGSITAHTIQIRPATTTRP